MSANVLKLLSMKKYERMLPRVFPGVARLEIRDKHNELFWSWTPTVVAQDADKAEDEDPVVVWSPFGSGIDKRQLPSGKMQFRAALTMREYGFVAWLTAAYDTQPSVALSSAPEPLRIAFADAQMFLQDDIDLQLECNQLAAELAERYEELNLMYSTKDQVKYLEEGQEALTSLVNNCADYLDVGLAALVCRERNINIHHISVTESPSDTEKVLSILATTVHDRVESQVQSVILNDPTDIDRVRLFDGRDENLLAHPVLDDHGTVIGMLAVVAGHDTHVFSNGDRNLLEVMAKKASRIIHTHHDSLTGLINRSGFESTLMTSLAGSQSKDLEHVLLHLNIDQLHVINDLMGYPEGDALIRRVSKCLKIVLRDTDVVSRLGGGEFGILLPNCDARQGYAVAEKLRNAIDELTVVSAQRTLDVSACIGIAHVNREADGIAGVMAAAEIACKAAKEEGKGRVEIFEKDNTTLLRRSEEIEWIGRVQEALRDNLFVLYCQPVMPLLDKSHVAHFEILIRLRDYNGDILSPFVFLPAAERYQLMPMVDRWVVHHSLKALSTCWKTIAAKNPVFCINLSGQSFSNPGFQPFVMDEIHESGIPPQNICFEVTETVAISHIDDAVNFMTSLRRFGCLFSLDDFGAGLSSFGYLKVLPVDYLKIDGSFVREIATDDVSRSMVEAIAQIGKTMDLSIIAEFVEDKATQDILRSIGVDYAQGFGVGKPAPLSDILSSLEHESSAASA
ncbi:MAG: EAL domain-containing protein [Woeseia sp.]|nr:EAL domain-containing protein [Woeseia sp.]